MILPKDNFDINLNLISLNVKGINNYFKREKMLKWLKRRSPDIIFLQETFSTKKVEKVWKTEWKGDMYFSHGSNHSKGVAILINPNVDYDVKECVVDSQGRYILLDVVINNVAFVLVNVYAPTSNSPNEQVQFYLDVKNNIQSVNRDADKYVLAGGDMNILMNVAMDRYGGNPRYNEKVMNQVNELLTSCDLIDIWRVRNPNARCYTWRQNSPLIQSRLDYWFASDALQDFISDTQICPAINTDHSAVSLKLSSNHDYAKGPSYWKFNNSLYDDVQYCNELTDQFVKWAKMYSDIKDARIIWDLFKFEIRIFTQSYSKKKAKIRRDDLQQLEDYVQIAEQHLCDNPSDNAKERWDNAKSNLEAEYEYVTQGIIIRSRAEWFEKGEKKSKYFLNLEKANKVKSTIRTVSDQNDEQCSDPKIILSKIKDFYKCLYSEKHIDLSSEKSSQFLNSPHISKLNEVEMQSCEGLLSKDECFTVLHTFKNNKAPGNDGLTAHFYKTFWHIIGDLIVNSLNTAAEYGELSNSQKQGVITLIHKKGKDKRQIGNYRPITLLNVELKIVSKAIALRSC
jgi:exonuclease III